MVYIECFESEPPLLGQSVLPSFWNCWHTLNLESLVKLNKSLIQMKMDEIAFTVAAQETHYETIHKIL